MDKFIEDIQKILNEGTVFDYEPDADDLMANEPVDSDKFNVQVKQNKKLDSVEFVSTPGTFAHWFGQDLTGQTYNGDIDCSREGLTSLKGAPQKVDGEFDCSYNNLTSLEGAPQDVSGNFYCSHNKLTSLKGAPQEVGGYFDCRNNSNLKSLDGIGNVKGAIYSDLI